MSSDDRDHRWFNSDRDHHSFRPTPSSYDLNSKIMLAAVLSLSVVILIVFTLHLYARLVLRRRREAFRGLPVVFRHPFQMPKRGLDQTVIASLPTFTVGTRNDLAAADTECAVCLSVLEEEDTVRELPNCKHVFHVDCVDTWLTTCSTCPVCRAEAQPRLEPEPREGPVGVDGAASPTAPPLLLEEVRLNLTTEAAASSSNNKIAGSSVSRLDSFKRILTRERSSNRINHSCVDQNHAVDLERH
ncbi:hypothetical protein AALP_AA4G206800 [Arabis alpina]|uniref:RING-type E3 ubiquitin transferase n=1 Tax=Arabis alpina TaxID=50452 RepID=A0A087H4K4_ARAAL|nr:hypothetical protein AALP_AA4G206800 [Arabis alpina]